MRRRCRDGAAVSRWGASVAARAGVFAASWWWAAAAGLTAGALARLVSPHPDVVGAGVLFVAAAGCVLGAGLATRRARTRRWTARPHGPPPGTAGRDDLDRSRPPT